MQSFSFPFRFPGSVEKTTGHIFAGIYLEMEEALVHGTLVHIEGRPEQRKHTILAAQSRELPRESTLFCRQWPEQSVSLANSLEDASRWFGSLSSFRQQTTATAAELVRELLQTSHADQDSLLLGGLWDPGFWFSSRSAYCMDCMDAAALARQTGISFCDGFIASDLAWGGLGGPLEAGPLWWLLASESQNRLILDLQPSALRLYWLPPECRGGLRNVLAFDAAPGMELLNQLVRRISYDKRTSDPTGTMAVQGKKIPELLTHWKSNSFFQTPLPRWSPQGIRSTPFILDAMNMAIEANWSVQDVLCTAVHFQADCLADAVQKNLIGKVEQIYLIGPGASNGLLCREIRQRIPHIETTLTSSDALPPKVLFPACAAVLAYWFVERFPGNLPQVTGCKQSRPLGRLVCGNPENFSRLARVLDQTGKRKASVGPQ